MPEVSILYGICVPVFALMAVAEVVFFERVTGAPYPRATALKSVRIWAVFILSTELYRHFALPLYELSWQHRVLSLPTDGWQAWIAVFLVEECLYYWLHRLMHASRWPWAHHRVHHEIDRLTYVTGLANGWFGILAGKWLYTLPLAFLGVSPTLLMTTMSVNLLYNFVLHSELLPRLGWLEWVFNTPTHHRVHHSYAAAHLDRNFGGVFIVFDRLFGTFAAEPAPAALRYGLSAGQPQTGAVELNVGEWRRMWAAARAAGTLRGALAAVFGPPPPEAGTAVAADVPLPAEREAG